MTYYLDVYLRFYALMTSPESWFAWLTLCVVLGFAIAVPYNSENKYSRKFLYYLIVFIVSSFCVRVVAWVLLPSPAYLGV